MKGILRKTRKPRTWKVLKYNGTLKIAPLYQAGRFLHHLQNDTSCHVVIAFLISWLCGYHPSTSMPPFGLKFFWNEIKRLSDEANTGVNRLVPFSNCIVVWQDVDEDFSDISISCWRFIIQRYNELLQLSWILITYNIYSHWIGIDWICRSTAESTSSFNFAFS